MLSLASLLNPAPPGPPPPTHRYRPSPGLSSPATSYSDDCTSLMFERHLASSTKPPKMVKESGGFVKSKAKGTVNFPPFENLNEASLREIKRYQVYPYGKIQEYCRHIPYNSGKKDFYEKTGRESFEVFQYIFKVPGDDSEYTVMWDYNVGLVRMTPFFKCCKYSKTMPAKMLNMNPGLRDITHSITGGSIMAQGYWMPHACAKAVCATFCAPIAGALIPIFGPDFPSQCTSPDAPEHGRMAIDPAIVAESGREAELFRRVFANVNAANVNSHLPLHPQQMHHYSHGSALPSPTSIPSPRLARRGLHRHGSPYDYERDRVDFGGRVCFKRGMDSPHATESDPEIHIEPETPSLPHASHHRSLPYSPMSPPRSSGWTVANHPGHSHTSSALSNNPPHTYSDDFLYPSGPNPLLSAIPRFGHASRLDHYQTSQRLPPISRTSAAWNTSKRPAPEAEVEFDYDGQSESSPTTTVTTATSRASGGRDRDREDDEPPTASNAATTGAEKNAAMLLMNLSVRDHRDVRYGGDRENGGPPPEGDCIPRGCGQESMSMSPVSATADGHRSKRRRATSM
ncbi:hypothetical protein N8I77_000911 [Diaporthe amygdali]|uniref:HTH APSES-type domain-containing protein n=1 Tax=Phomopsis amygdali TaxID=1214568 RepID=A0AAD9SPT5_PHOAM|nr:hypothetical protein N8I77_000911 [Diaporthe amygdali]